MERVRREHNERLGGQTSTGSVVADYLISELEKQGSPDEHDITVDEYLAVTEEIEIAKGYEPLAAVLIEALNQAQFGKGAKCHANGLPFLEQPIMQGARESGEGGLTFQSRKKILEAQNCEDDERAITDILGAIVYNAAQVLYRREQAKKDAPYGD